MVMVHVGTYASNGTLAVILEAVEETEYVEVGEEFYLTVNLKEPAPAPNMAYLDVNNMGDKAAAFLEKYGLAKNTGLTGKSGFVTYPLYEFDIQKLRRLRRENEAFFSEDDCAVDTVEQFCQAVCEKLNEKQNETDMFHVMNCEREDGLAHYISMDVRGWNLSPKVEVDSFWEKYDYLGNMDELLERIMTVFMLYKDAMDAAEPWDLNDLDAIKKHLGFRLINPKDLPEEAAHCPYYDMEVVFDIHIIPELGMNFSVLECDLDKWNIKPEEAFELAKRNMPELLPARVLSMRDNFLFAPDEGYLLQSSEGAECLKESDMEFLLRNETGMYGAGAILYSGVAKYVAEQPQCNYYIMLALTQEALIVPDGSDQEKTPREMKLFFENVLLKELLDDIILSKTLYYYNAKKDEIMAVEG